MSEILTFTWIIYLIDSEHDFAKKIFANIMTETLQIRNERDKTVIKKKAASLSNRRPNTISIESQIYM